MKKILSYALIIFFLSCSHSPNKEETYTIHQEESTQLLEENAQLLEENAQLLEEAKAKGDWAAVKRLADSGYKQALVPLAANYARTGRYDEADGYAQKAKSNGIKDANDVINYLNDLGYYDDKK